jgi:putative MATE family efflux protein
MIGLLAQNVVNVTDTAFLGHVGEVELGASVMGGIYYICLFTLFFGFSTGTQIIIGRRNGEKNYSAIGPVMIQGMIFLLFLAAAILVLSHFLTGGIMRFMISSEVIWKATMTFLKWRMFSLIFDVFNIMFRAFYVGIIKTKILTAGSFVLAVTNIILDYLLIFGKFGFPEMGLEGAAIASVISTFASALFFIIYTFFRVDRKQYGFTRIMSVDFQLLKHVLRISVYMMFQYFISWSTYFLFFVVIERQGQHALAIANVVRSIYVVMFIPVNALSATSNTLVSNIIGEGKIKKVMPLIYRITRLSMTIVSVCVLLLCLFSKTVLSLYTNDLSLINESVPALYVVAIAMIISSIGCIFFNSVSGTGNTKAAMMLEMGVLALYVVHIYVTGAYYKLPVHICMTAEFVYFTGLFTGSVLYLRFADWKKKTV